ncbi:uncharacterized protein VTP21DRAFT_10065 [Calcarisporiella thermophila]|uniref:uncharacterized protein n=1 Tax=Calcarisporiella thermophila TaxID=911321 RepID=UPI0037442948
MLYGYEIDSAPGQPGRIVTPPMLSSKISLGSSQNTNKFSFVGTRPEILEWMRHHGNIVLENAVFTGQSRPSSFHIHNEIVIDLLSYADPEARWIDTVWAYFAPDKRTEKVRVELRARVEKVDESITTLRRVIVNSGIAIGDLVDDLERQWFTPDPSYVEQLKHIVDESPGPQVILSSDVPMGIVVDNDPRTRQTSEQ